MENQPPEPKTPRDFKVILTVIVLGLATAIAGGLLWLFVLGSATPIGAGWFLFSFAAGLSMIVLPCTLPLAFVIVPLSMGKGVVKGLGIALAFGSGVALTLSMYGVLAAIAGEVAIGTLGAPLETVKNWLYLVAGLFAFVFALGALGLVKARMPSYMGAAPAFIQKRQDIAKAFFLGLFLGNIGIGCPHPATPVILTRIAVSGDVFYGWLLFFVHAVGRILPLLFLAILGILGVNALKGLLKHKDAIERATGWAMVFVAGFLVVLGLFTHDWWVYSGIHSFFEVVTQEERYTGIIAQRLDVAAPHAHGLQELVGKTGLLGLPLWLGNWVLVALWVIPLWWYWFRERKRIGTLPDTEQVHGRALLSWKKWFFAAVTLLLGLLFIYTIPHWFQQHKALEVEKALPATVTMATVPAPPAIGAPTLFTFSLKDEKGEPLGGLAIDHERILHVVIVSEDFKTFAHIHPEDLGPIPEAMIAQALFPVRFTFPASGRYLISVAFVHHGQEASSQFLVDADGLRNTVTLTKDFTRIKQFDDYTVSLEQRPSALRSAQETTLRYSIERSGSPVTDLEPYLGAPMHLSIVSADLSTFIHTHGEVHGDAAIEAHVVFPHPGLYQIFGEIKHQGRVILTSFMVEVGAGEDGALSAPHGHE